MWNKPTKENNYITKKLDQQRNHLKKKEREVKVASRFTQTKMDLYECDNKDERIEILKFMRDYYSRFESFPIVRHVCKNVHQEKECLYEQFIDPIKAWKIAGFPKPTPDAIARIKHELD